MAMGTPKFKIGDKVIINPKGIIGFVDSIHLIKGEINDL